MLWEVLLYRGRRAQLLAVKNTLIEFSDQKSELFKRIEICFADPEVEYDNTSEPHADPDEVLLILGWIEAVAA